MCLRREVAGFGAAMFKGSYRRDFSIISTHTQRALYIANFGLVRDA